METNYKQEAMVDVAYAVLNEQSEPAPVAFADLWNEVAKRKELDADNDDTLRSEFYTQLILDSRLIITGDNHWDLRTRHTLDEIQINVNDIYTDDDELESEGDDGDQVSDEDSFDDN